MKYIQSACLYLNVLLCGAALQKKDFPQAAIHAAAAVVCKIADLGKGGAK